VSKEEILQNKDSIENITSKKSILKSTNLEDKENTGDLNNVNFNEIDEILSE
jgi:hypothetical protein